MQYIIAISIGVACGMLGMKVYTLVARYLLVRRMAKVMGFGSTLEFFQFMETVTNEPFSKVEKVLNERIKK